MKSICLRRCKRYPVTTLLRQGVPRSNATPRSPKRKNKKRPIPKREPAFSQTDLKGLRITSHLEEVPYERDGCGHGYQHQEP